MSLTAGEWALVTGATLFGALVLGTRANTIVNIGAHEAAHRYWDRDARPLERFEEDVAIIRSWEERPVWENAPKNDRNETGWRHGETVYYGDPWKWKEPVRGFAHSSDHAVPHIIPKAIGWTAGALTLAPWVAGAYVLGRALVDS